VRQAFTQWPLMDVTLIYLSWPALTSGCIHLCLLSNYTLVSWMNIWHSLHL